VFPFTFSQLYRLLKPLPVSPNRPQNALTVTRDVALTPLPRVYDDYAAVAGGAVSPVVAIGGPKFSAEAITRISQTSSAQLQAQVLAPLAKWLDVYASLVARSKDVDQLRLELDSRGHTVERLATDVDHLRARLTKEGASSKVERKLDARVKALQHKEGKRDLCRQNYAQIEDQVYADLAALIKDSKWLGTYVVTALKLQGEKETKKNRGLRILQSLTLYFSLVFPPRYEGFFYILFYVDHDWRDLDQ
jgi:hypothetical protein